MYFSIQQAVILVLHSGVGRGKASHRSMRYATPISHDPALAQDIYIFYRSTYIIIYQIGV